MRLRFTLIDLVITGLAVILVAFSLFVQFKDFYSQEAMKSSEQILSQLSDNLNTYMDEVYRLTLTPYYSREIMALLESPKPETLAGRMQKRRTINDFLDYTTIFPRKDIQRVSIISDDSYVSDKYATLQPTYEAQLASWWYQEVMRTNETFVVLPDPDDFYDSHSNHTFSVVRRINDMGGRNSASGVIKVDANFRAIQEMCGSLRLGENSGVLLRTESGQIIFSTLSPASYSLTEKSLPPFDALEGKITGAQDAKGEFILHGVSLKHFKWQLVLVSTLSDVNNEIVQIRNFVILISLLCLGIISYFLYKVIAYSLRPFYQVVDLMRSVEQGQSSIRYIGHDKNEIGYMGNTLNDMLDSLAASHHRNIELNNRIHTASLRQRDMQLRLLYSQIKPHFIYNALNMISIQIQQNLPDEAVSSINRLSLLLRGIAYIDKDITLKVEMDLLESYLSIKKAQHGDNISYTIEVDPSLLSIRLPALMLQPIVENVLEHAFDPQHHKIDIRVRGVVDGPMMKLYVEDNGAGMKKEDIVQLMARIEQPDVYEEPEIEDLSDLGGLGLVNINSRLKARYGENCQLKVENGKKSGIRVSIILPRTL